MGDNVIVTLTDPGFIQGTVALAHSLKQVKCKYDILALHDGSLSRMDIDILSSYNIKAREVPIIKNPYTVEGENPRKFSRRFESSNVFCKIACWSLTEYEKVLFIDSDIICLRNFDNLFEHVNIPSSMVAGVEIDRMLDNRHWVPGRINTGFMLLRPSMKIYNDLCGHAKTGILESYDGTDQGFLCTYFADKIFYINKRYNVGQFDKRIDQFIINLHYVNSPKPWQGDEPLSWKEKRSESIWNIWHRCFEDCVTGKWSEILGKHLNELNTLVYDNINDVEGNILYNEQARGFNKSPRDRLSHEYELKRWKLYHVVKRCKTVMEIGVNGGHSALIMFLSNPSIQYYGFDIGWHPYTKRAVNYITEQFKNVTYIEGDSEKTVPGWKQDIIFDCIHIDGGHAVSKARNDILNCREYANKDTILIFDDCNTVGSMGPELLKLWDELVIQGIIIEDPELNTRQQLWDSKIGRYKL